MQASTQGSILAQIRAATAQFHDLDAAMLGDQPFMDRRSAPFGAAFPNYSLVVWDWAHNPSACT
jgi:hypothetical protein